ncbi:MAG: hypothetical protein WCV92_00185 [Candidatus Buchananbacteria bacterium]
MANSTKLYPTKVKTKSTLAVIIIAVAVIAGVFFGWSSFNGITYLVSSGSRTSLINKCPLYHSADVNKNYIIESEEINYVNKLRESKNYHCDKTAYSGYAVGYGNKNCKKHSSDYREDPESLSIIGDWKINLSEFLRLVQFYNAGGYKVDCKGEDGFAPSANSVVYHSADVNKNYIIDKNEMDYVLKLQASKSYHCDSKAFSGYATGTGSKVCKPHNSDYLIKPESERIKGSDWIISMSELLRLVQFVNTGGYKFVGFENSEDGFEPSAPCIGEGQAIILSGAGSQNCCAGLKLLPPKNTSEGTAGICTAKCGDKVCDSNLESCTNCIADCPNCKI